MSYFGSASNHAGRLAQAMRVLVHTHLFCLLGTMPQTPLNSEFHSAATHFANSLYSVNETSFYSDSKPFEGMDACLNAFLIVVAVSSPRFRAASITS